MPLEQTEFNFDYAYPERKPTSRRKPSVTSKAAHDSVKEHKEIFYEKIIEGLRKLKVGGTSHEIAEASGIEYAQAHKRIPELITAGKVFNTGITRLTPYGRKAKVRQLCEFKN